VTTSTSLLRSCARAAVLAAASGALLLSAPAGADVPEGWSDPDPIGTGHGLMILLVWPLVIVVVLVGLSLLPSLLRGEKFTHTSGTGEQWLGGPTQGSAELEGKQDAAAGGASGTY